MKNTFRSLTVLFVLACNFTAIAQIPKSEKQYLIKFHKSTLGENWQNPWNLNEDPTTWYGVQIENNHVVGLKLYRNNLKGKIPAGITALTNLETLNLAFNALEGNLPQEIFKVGTLKAIRLEMNKFSGSLPVDYTKMHNLEELSMFNNLLEGEIPDGIGSLQNLKILNLSSNYLEGHLPKSIEKLSKLEQLELFGNKLAGTIDVELGKLMNLKELILSYNKFEGDLPSSVASLNNLEFIQLQGNDFRSLNSLMQLQSQKLAVFDSDDEFLNMKFSKVGVSETRLVDTKFEDVKH
ncbi:hypothetical protein [Maribacter sp. MAR_2009_72]|uniref:leucine-rich repeat domain-containing protein n=1 Tax=Maribacter sp. MAR_2009_72 TaxID=1250050 RepID=UPI00119B115F|nr:hypothetical protein [Maribacter sp. MAR_2009_72]TVZ15522.1 leucine rich repeat (LRR) protein [Maribacter sp. MAR_2009_72]